MGQDTTRGELFESDGAEGAAAAVVENLWSDGASV